MTQLPQAATIYSPVFLTLCMQLLQSIDNVRIMTMLMPLISSMHPSFVAMWYTVQLFVNGSMQCSKVTQTDLIKNDTD